MLRILALLALFFLNACVTTTDIETYDKRKPLAKDAPVEVFHKAEPTFGYDVVCKAKVQVKGNFVATDLKSYVGKAKEVARDCGTNMALIESLTGYRGSGTNIMVTIKAIEKTSSPSAFAKVLQTDKSFIKKLGTAASLGNITNRLKRHLHAISRQ